MAGTGTQSDTREAALRVRRTATLIHSQAAVADAVTRLQSQLTRDYADRDPVFVIVMNGGLFLAGTLLPGLDFPLTVDYCHATRYRGGTRGGEIEWRASPQTALEGRHVVVVDDILDEGHTLRHIVERFSDQNAKSVKTLVLVEKRHARKAWPGMRPDYCELTAPDHYLFGCGMDYRGYWRNCPGIYRVAD